ncbi:hypothetical protein [Roseateles cavernae]|uniref:hypothetical protein n=1 Tax=Roseateles cavernae TaxID=3153578 RepID=UPI0032E4098A
MNPSEYPIVGSFKNETTSDLTLHLELIPEEVILAPGHSVDLVAKPTDDLLPLSIEPVDGGYQIHACRAFDPDWHVRFNGKLLKAGNPTRLRDHE